jgi:hypothetical protein
VLTAVVSKVNIVFSIINTLLFIIYELDEAWHLHDESYEDIKEFAIGLALGEVLLLAMDVLKLF